MNNNRDARIKELMKKAKQREEELIKQYKKKQEILRNNYEKEKEMRQRNRLNSMDINRINQERRKENQRRLANIIIHGNPNINRNNMNNINHENIVNNFINNLINRITINDDNNNDVNKNNEELNKKIDKALQDTILTEESLNKIDNKQCLICLDNYKIGEKICFLPCFHLFHSLCIKCWIKRTNKCPLCKHIIKID